MKTFAIAAFASLALAGAASAAPVDYVAGSVGALTQELSTDNVSTGLVSVAAGKNVGPVRVEGEYVRLTDIETRGTKGNLFNVNVAYDFQPILGFTPFVGLGAGYGDIDRSGVRGDNDGLVLNGTVGASRALTERLAVTAQYRVFKGADIDVATRSGKFDSLDVQAVTIGARYSF